MLLIFAKQTSRNLFSYIFGFGFLFDSFVTSQEKKNFTHRDAFHFSQISQNLPRPASRLILCSTNRIAAPLLSFNLFFSIHLFDHRVQKSTRQKKKIHYIPSRLSYPIS
ncbi:hypothetical protein M426DRAFT_183427 [Hypoxylon sp. CI-4A]|nr:hypothetical protein M426DRAFT_183427 [Hypoxylon sp. CI-4A]